MKKEELSRIAKSCGAAAIATARIEDILNGFPFLSGELTNGLRTGISIAARLSNRILAEITDGPTRLYFHHYRRLNHLLDFTAHSMTAALLESGFEAVPIPASQTIDWKNQTGHLSHKAVAVKAGLGWLGRNNLLVTPAWGAQVRLVTVLTDAEFDEDQVVENGCGDCRACIDACPAGALGETYADYDRDACLQKMKEMCKAAGIGHYICGICVKACRGMKK